MRRDKYRIYAPPDWEVLTQTYGMEGLLASLSSSRGETLVSGVTYTASGQPRQYQVGNGSSVQQTYWGLDLALPASGTPYGALRSSTWQAGTSPALVDRQLGYDAVGNLTSLTDGVNGESLGYSFDHLDRLLSASAPLNETVSYDVLGNITARNGVAYQYGDAAHVHAVTATNGQSYAHDANGSLTSRGTVPGTQTVRYDPERRPTRLAENGATVWRAAYDGDGVRRKRLDAKGTIHYLGGYERNVGNGQALAEVVSTYYVALGKLIAFRKNGVLRYVGTDHLGSTVRVSSSSFAAEDQQRYRPFGQSRGAGTNLGTDHKYTGQIEDAHAPLGTTEGEGGSTRESARHHF